MGDSETINARSFSNRSSRADTPSRNSATVPSATNSASRSRTTGRPAIMSPTHQSVTPMQCVTIAYAELAPSRLGFELTRPSPSSAAIATISLKARSTNGTNSRVFTLRLSRRSTSSIAPPTSARTSPYCSTPQLWRRRSGWVGYSQPPPRRRRISMCSICASGASLPCVHGRSRGHVCCSRQARAVPSTSQAPVGSAAAPATSPAASSI